MSGLNDEWFWAAATLIARGVGIGIIASGVLLGISVCRSLLKGDLFRL